MADNKVVPHVPKKQATAQQARAVVDARPAIRSELVVKAALVVLMLALIN